MKFEQRRLKGRLCFYSLILVQTAQEFLLYEFSIGGSPDERLFIDKSNVT
jgi:hypothetical protein